MVAALIILFQLTLALSRIFFIVDKENNADSAYLSIAERVKLFSAKVESPSYSSYDNVLRNSKRAGSRFRTQPITFKEVRIAEQCSIESTCSNLGAFIQNYVNG